ncbi:SIMPL domain-containing protein [Desulfovirgula thermocuniculi]|uniref:SIMPL domain-containing protein n=1 Tax=Desulfovirgula thermocuniculi TaxID=348842 RepID=UPI000413C709|nr:SIMPL domain-containing protein [Desulfovirgula thermocuniculi]
MHTKANRIVGCFVSLIVLFCFALPVWAAEPDAGGIAVIGTGRVYVVPDMAEVTVGVVTQGTTAAEAQAENGRRMQAVIQKLKELGLDDADMHTGGLSVHPEYNEAPAKEEPSQIVAYRAVNSLVVKVKPVDMAGKVIDVALASGANQVQSLRLMPGDTTAPGLEALALAAQDARRKAEALARALGVKLGALQSASVDVYWPVPPVYRDARALPSESTPVLPGQIEITATVHVRYAIAAW